MKFIYKKSIFSSLPYGVYIFKNVCSIHAFLYPSSESTLKMTIEET